MAGTEAFQLAPPTVEDLLAARRAWDTGVTRYQLRPDDSWFRVLRADSAGQARERARRLFPADAQNRFTPINRRGQIVPSGYAGSTRKVALWETVLRNVRHGGIRWVPRHETQGRYLVEVRAINPTSLLDLRRPRDANLVAPGRRPPDLTHAWPAAYHLTRAWAQALHHAIPDLPGFIYESHQLGGSCMVLWGEEGADVFEDLHVPQSIAVSPVRNLLIEEALKASASVDFGEDDEL